jgi:hypothetical protein
MPRPYHPVWFHQLNSILWEFKSWAPDKAVFSCHCRLGPRRPPLIHPNTRVLQTDIQGRREQNRKSIIFRFIGNRGTAPLIPKLASRWDVSGQIYAPAALPTSRETRYQLNMGLGALLGRPGPFGDDKNRFAPSKTKSSILEASFPTV